MCVETEAQQQQQQQQEVVVESQKTSVLALQAKNGWEPLLLPLYRPKRWRGSQSTGPSKQISCY